VRLQFPDPPQKNDAIFIRGARAQQPFVFAYQQKCVEVVHGPSCRKEREIYVDKCMGDGVAVCRRRSGGGTVVLSPGMVITIVVGHREKNETAPRIFGRIHNAMIAILDPEKALNIKREGISDLSINGRKLLGSSLYMQNSPFLYYYQSSLMVTSDCTLMTKYLAPPPREPLYRRGRPHEAFCTTLKNEGCPLSPETIVRCFINTLPNYLQPPPKSIKRHQEYLFVS
jgi:lipoate-protein ligase A